MDSLSLILDDMHFDGVVFASTYNTSPWRWRLATPGLASFHIVTSGQAWLIREGEEPALIQPGDLIVLPAGASVATAGTTFSQLNAVGGSMSLGGTLALLGGTLFGVGGTALPG